MRTFRTAASACTLLGFMLACSATLGSPEATSPSSDSQSLRFNLLPRSLQRNPQLTVMIVTELTPAGRALPPASADHPQYYVLLPGHYTSLGDVVGGERPPSEPALQRLLRRSLAASGYLAADSRHTPTIAVHYDWGSWNRLLPPGENGAANPTAKEDLQDPLAGENFLERATVVGGVRFADEILRHLSDGSLDVWERSPIERVLLMQEVSEDRYFLTANAYYYPAALKQRKVLLWRTSISTNSLGVGMDQSMPQLVATAAPYFGHATNGPVRLYRPVVKDGRVIIGVPTVKQDLPPDHGPASGPGQNPPAR